MVRGATHQDQTGRLGVDQGAGCQGTVAQVRILPAELMSTDAIQGVANEVMADPWMLWRPPMAAAQGPWMRPNGDWHSTECTCH